jgi:hypothetical protein
LDVASGKVITDLTARHRGAEFQRFLNLINREVRDDLEVHVIVDNSSTNKTPSVQRWLVRHPRFHMHFTPTYSSWLNLVWVNRPWEARLAVAV